LICIYQSRKTPWIAPLKVSHSDGLVKAIAVTLLPFKEDGLM
jgi:hypothetical protein